MLIIFSAAAAAMLRHVEQICLLSACYAADDAFSRHEALLYAALLMP